MPIATPSTVQAITSFMTLYAPARISNPAEMTRFEAISGWHPPWRSISRPTDWPTTADKSKAPENRPKNTLVDKCNALAIGAPSIAGV